MVLVSMGSFLGSSLVREFVGGSLLLGRFSRVISLLISRCSYCVLHGECLMGLGFYRLRFGCGC